jgi:hypothetical protein
MRKEAHNGGKNGGDGKKEGRNVLKEGKERGMGRRKTKCER